MRRSVWLSLMFLFSISAFAQEEATKDVYSINFRTRKGLVIVPVMLNDTIRVNLILDPGSKNLVLFGKRYYRKLQRTNGDRVSGEPGASENLVSYNNTVTIGPLSEKDVSIVVVSNTNLINFFNSVNGVIGTDLFEKLNPVVDRRKQVMTFSFAGQLEQPSAKILRSKPFSIKPVLHR